MLVALHGGYIRVSSIDEGFASAAWKLIRGIDCVVEKSRVFAYVGAISVRD